MSGTRVRACVRESDEITRNLWRRLSDQSLACVADRLDLILWQVHRYLDLFNLADPATHYVFITMILNLLMFRGYSLAVFKLKTNSLEDL